MVNILQWFLEKPRVATYMGCVGTDKYSKILEDKARADGLNVRYQYTKKEATGTCAVLITGNERSLCANLAAANCFSLSHIEEPENKKFVEIAEYIYVSVGIRRNSCNACACIGSILCIAQPLILKLEILGIFLNCEPGNDTSGCAACF